MEEKKMTVRVIRAGEMSFDETSYKSVDKELFDMLVDMKSENVDEEVEKLPEMYYFKDKTAYANTAWKYDIDAEKPVYVDSKGGIFCFRSAN